MITKELTKQLSRIEGLLIDLRRQLALPAYPAKQRISKGWSSEKHSETYAVLSERRAKEMLHTVEKMRRMPDHGPLPNK